MKSLHLTVIFVLVAVAALLVNNVFAQTDNNSTQTMKLVIGSIQGSNYENGTYVQTINFEGNVGTVEIGQPVFIKIFKNGSLYKTDLITQGNITSDKLFYYPITIRGQVGLDEYGIYFTYGNENVKKILPVTPTGGISMPDTSDSAPPLKQFRSGIQAQSIQCETGDELILKSQDGSPACVKPTTAKILIERGWGHCPLRLGFVNCP